MEVDPQREWIRLGRAGVETLEQFALCWEGLEDPRSGNAGLYDFDELLVIALCVVLCGGQGAVDMALFAKANESFLRGFLALENGLPSHDAFSRLFRKLDPDQLRACIQQLMAEFSAQCQGGPFAWGFARLTELLFLFGFEIETTDPVLVSYN